MKLLLAICFLLSAAHHVECRHHPKRQPDYKLFVFGDSFVDAGNTPKSELSRRSRAWYYPYGSSDSDRDDSATGRYSNGPVQSDFLANILGLDASPPPYRLRKANKIDPSGENFAVAGAGVFDSPEGSPTLGHQVVNQFGRLVDLKIVKDEDLQKSVALISITSGSDYPEITARTSPFEMMGVCENVTDAIVDGVRRLQKMGVRNVLVNTMPPIGCSPYRSSSNNHSGCEASGNAVASMHNTILKQKLRGEDDVLLLDLNTVFTSLIEQETESSLSLQFKHKLTACCDTEDPTGYCGQEDDGGNPMYTVCLKPDTHFYWDYMHPTKAGWKAVMSLLESSIKDFLSTS
ncbi:hypothetical protein ACP70R_008394 [Stipagrostis hirtigluma subsp. patula]